MFVLLFGFSPFHAETDELTFEKIKAVHYPPDLKRRPPEL